jgi:signal transduction histidine kinase
MAAEIAHEMNNDLTILMGNVELFPLFLGSGNTSGITQKLPVMKETLEKIAGFAESLVSYGKPQEHFEPIDIKRIITHTLELVEPQNRFDNVRIATEISSDISPVYGDAGQIQQVVVNLLNNAADELKECERAERLIEVKARLSADRGSLVVSVTDNGRGIPESTQPRIFRERFTSKENGTGYGLLACGIIARRHGGDIRFHTMPHAGTCFELRLPIPKRASGAGSESSADPVGTPDQ